MPKGGWAMPGILKGFKGSAIGLIQSRFTPLKLVRTVNRRFFGLLAPVLFRFHGTLV